MCCDRKAIHESFNSNHIILSLCVSVSLSPGSQCRDGGCPPSSAPIQPAGHQTQLCAGTLPGPVQVRGPDGRSVRVCRGGTSEHASECVTSASVSGEREGGTSERGMSVLVESN